MSTPHERLSWSARSDRINCTCHHSFPQLLLAEAERHLSSEPLLESRNMKTLRPNPVAQRELRLFGKYRVLFNVNKEAQEGTMILVGEKRGNSLIVQGEEFTGHEGDTTE